LGRDGWKRAARLRAGRLLQGLRERYLASRLSYLDYPFQNKLFGCGSLAHFSYLKRLIFSKTLVF